MNCIICGEKKQTKLLEQPDYSLWRCHKCKVVKTVGKFDDTQYESVSEMETQFRTQRPLFEDYAQRMAKLLPVSKGRLLDVGCGLGWFVKLASQIGFQAEGIDCAKACICVGLEKLKVNIKHSSLFDFHPEYKFDIITANHVVEHSDDPREFLWQVKKILQPDGWVLISCPNFDSLMLWLFQERWYGLMPKQHRFQFSPKSLKYLFEKEGFKVEEIIVNNLDYNSEGLKGLIFKGFLAIASVFSIGDQVVIIARI